MSTECTTAAKFAAEHEGHALRYAEDVTAWRSVGGVDEDGTLRIEGYYETDGDGDNARLFCLDCLASCAVTVGDQIEWQ